ncbi:unnamed protein product [Nippostrongylus brasiliensis]|uniref:Uncharacterized protein n=1 Tax=Nippostrongylus brasiliensis TaxID=27835 RepID=A0A0N4YJR2_NIPBR|nr:unnamed protein product [Nippostrongylus brasiliensis]
MWEPSLCDCSFQELIQTSQPVRMARLLFALAYVLFISDGALSQDCANLKEYDDFCDLMSMAKDENDKIPPLLKRKAFRAKQEEFTKGASDAQQKVADVLKKTETKERLIALKEALTAEGTVLSEVKEFCEDKKTGREGERCAEVLQRFADAVDALVRAVLALPIESNMRKTIFDAYTDYNYQYLSEENSDLAQLTVTLTKTVVAAL